MYGEQERCLVVKYWGPYNGAFRQADMVQLSEIAWILPICLPY